MKRLFTICTVLLAAAVPALAGDGHALESVNLFGSYLLAVGAYYTAAPLLRALGVKLPLMFMMLASTIDVSALNTAFGSEYHDSSKGQQDLKTKLFETSRFDELFTIEYTDKSEWRKETGATGEVLQAYQDTFTDSGSLTFTPSKYSLDAVKIDWSHNYLTLKRGFNGWMTKVNEKPTSSALARYIVELLSKQFVEDVEKKACFLGVRVAPTPGTAGPAANAMDGFKQVINQGIAANTISPIAVGASPTDAEQYVEYIEDFCAGIQHTEWMTDMTVAMNLTNYLLYREGFRLKYNLHYKDAEETVVRTHPAFKVQGYVAMGTSNKVFCSPKDKIYKVVNPGEREQLEFHVENVDRKIKVWADIFMKYCIWDHERFYTNDVEESVLSS
jgi:hypothetical protein